MNMKFSCHPMADGAMVASQIISRKISEHTGCAIQRTEVPPHQLKTTRNAVSANSSRYRSLKMESTTYRGRRELLNIDKWKKSIPFRIPPTPAGPTIRTSATSAAPRSVFSRDQRGGLVAARRSTAAWTARGERLRSSDSTREPMLIDSR